MSAVAVFLENPKTLHNLGSAVRGCAAYGVPELRWTGERIGRKLNSTKQARLPRELRMKDYSTIVNFCHNNNRFQNFVMAFLLLWSLPIKRKALYILNTPPKQYTYLGQKTARYPVYFECIASDL